MKRILLGKITAAHGIRGQVKIHFYGEDPATLELGPLYSGPESEASIELTLGHMAGKALTGAIKGVKDRNDAETFKGTELWLDRDLLPEPDDGEYYIADLIGLRAVMRDGSPAGKIISFQNFGAGNLLEIQPEKGASYYLPFTADCVPSVDVGGGEITIDPPDGIV